MRPRILILMHYMELGGAESALLGLLQAHDPLRADIDLFIYSHRGDLMEYIPGNVNLLPEVPIYSLLEAPIADVLKMGYSKLALARLMARQETFSYSKYNVNHLDDLSGFTFQQSKTVKLLPNISPDIEYDLAISFLTPHYIVLDKVRAKKKIGWIHTDYSNVFINKEMEYLMWSQLDYIASISEEVSKKFCSIFPLLNAKIVLIENILSVDFIRRRSEEFESSELQPRNNEVHLLSIGRYSFPKRFDEIGSICRMVIDNLRRQGSSIIVKWFVIGYGSQEEENKMLENIEKENVVDNVIIMGKKSNPYPYIRACDIYVQPSYEESFGRTIKEAMILNKPVVSTNTVGASEQITNGENGLLTEITGDALAEAIYKLISDDLLYTSIINQLELIDYSNEERDYQKKWEELLEL